MLVVMAAGAPLRVAAPEVDLCELNHVLHVTGDPAFSQVILWRWYSQWPMKTGYRVTEYFMTSSDVMILWKHGRRHVVFRDRSGVCYEIRCKTFRETITGYDPEMLDRQAWPIGSRTPYFSK